MEEPEVEENQMREAALASTPLFQPNFKSSKVTQAQLDKFKVFLPHLFHFLLVKFSMLKCRVTLYSLKTNPVSAEVSNMRFFGDFFKKNHA